MMQKLLYDLSESSAFQLVDGWLQHVTTTELLGSLKTHILHQSRAGPQQRIDRFHGDHVP